MTIKKYVVIGGPKHAELLATFDKRKDAQLSAESYGIFTEGPNKNFPIATAMTARIAIEMGYIKAKLAEDGE